MLITEFCDRIGAGRREIDNWVNRREQIGLRSQYAETVSGIARDYTRENVLELAGLAAFTRAGIPVSTAVAYVDTILRAKRARKPVREWCVFASGKVESAISTDDLGGLDMQKLARPDDGSAPVVVAVCTGEVVRRVDRLFAAG